MSEALIVVDVQKGFDDPSWGRRNNPACEGNVAALIEAFRRRGEPIVFVRHDSDEDVSPLRPDEPGNAFREEVHGAPDLLVTKRVNSAFLGDPPLAPWLADHGLGRIAVCGVTTNHSARRPPAWGRPSGSTSGSSFDGTHTFDRAGPDGRIIPAEVLAQVTANEPPRGV